MAPACHSVCKEPRMHTTLKPEMAGSSEVEKRRHVYVILRPYGKDTGELIQVGVGRRKERSNGVLSSS